MKEWWKTWSTVELSDHSPEFADVDTSITSFLETTNTWNEYASGEQDANKIKSHKADKMTRVKPPANDLISDDSAFKIHRVVVFEKES